MTLFINNTTLQLSSEQLKYLGFLFSVSSSAIIDLKAGEALKILIKEVSTKMTNSIYIGERKLSKDPSDPKILVFDLGDEVGQFQFKLEREHINVLTILNEILHTISEKIEFKFDFNAAEIEFLKNLSSHCNPDYSLIINEANIDSESTELVNSFISFHTIPDTLKHYLYTMCHSAFDNYFLTLGEHDISGITAFDHTIRTILSNMYTVLYRANYKFEEGQVYTLNFNDTKNSEGETLTLVCDSLTTLCLENIIKNFTAKTRNTDWQIEFIEQAFNYKPSEELKFESREFDELLSKDPTGSEVAQGIPVERLFTESFH